MTHRQAIKLAIDTMARELQRLAVDANLYDWRLATYPAARNASRKRDRLRAAIEVLKNDPSDR